MNPETGKMVLKDAVALLVDARERLKQNKITESYYEELESGIVSLTCPEDLARLQIVIDEHPLKLTEKHLQKIRGESE